MPRDQQTAPPPPPLPTPPTTHTHTLTLSPRIPIISLFVTYKKKKGFARRVHTQRREATHDIVHMTFRYLSLFIFKELFNLDCSAENKVGFYIHRSKEIKGCLLFFKKE